MRATSIAAIALGVTFGSIAALGCAGKAAPSGPTIDAGYVDASAPIDAGGSSSACPSSEPTGSCGKSGLICEYGSQLDYQCNTVATCSPSHGWVLTAPSCVRPDGGVCPASANDVPVGDTCATLTECDYAATRCACTIQLSGPVRIVDGGTANLWECDTPAMGCPTPRPAIGSACMMQGSTCDYGSCTLPDGVALACMNGSWQPVFVPCPD